jgi:hypothetical protein
MECDIITSDLNSAELRAILDALIWGEPIPEGMHEALYAKLNAQWVDKSLAPGEAR